MIRISLPQFLREVLGARLRHRPRALLVESRGDGVAVAHADSAIVYLITPAEGQTVDEVRIELEQYLEPIGPTSPFLR